MTNDSIDPKNILVIHFGQMGDVILALPAFRALRRRFPDSKLTAMTGKSSAMIARLAGVFDEMIVVDRVELRDGPKLKSIAEIFRIVGDTRRRRFDMVVDLHSLAETNLLGFLSGARTRVYAHRENRSLDFLGKSANPVPREDKSKHVTDRYLDVLKALGIEDAPRVATIEADPTNAERMRELFSAMFGDRAPVGFFPGAGHPSRRWSLENFAALAARLRETEPEIPLAVILGPEELDLVEESRRIFPSGTAVLDKLFIPDLIAATPMMRFLVSNDTGVVHVGAIAGARLVLVLDNRSSSTFTPLSESVEIVSTGTIGEITVDDVLTAARRFLS